MCFKTQFESCGGNHLFNVASSADKEKIAIISRDDDDNEAAKANPVFLLFFSLFF